MERTNLDRAEEAGYVFKESVYARQDNDEVTNLYDFICDLLHYADTLDRAGEFSPEERVGDFVLGMAEYHYHAEVAEEAA